MKKHSMEFKVAVLSELISGTSTAAQICRKYNIASGLLYYWKKRHESGELARDKDDGRIETQQARIDELERKVGQLTMENDLLKKAREKFLEEVSRKKSSLPLAVPKDGLSNGSVKYIF